MKYRPIPAFSRLVGRAPQHPKREVIHFSSLVTLCTELTLFESRMPEKFPDRPHGNGDPHEPPDLPKSDLLCRPATASNRSLTWTSSPYRGTRRGPKDSALPIPRLARPQISRGRIPSEFRNDLKARVKNRKIVELSRSRDRPTVESYSVGLREGSGSQLVVRAHSTITSPFERRSIPSNCVAKT